MTTETQQRLFGYQHAFDHPMTLTITLLIAGGMAVAPGLIWLLGRTGRVSPGQRTELVHRYLSWLVIIPALLGPVLLGGAWTIAGITALSLLCYREFARATGLFREKIVSLLVVLGILAVMFAALDHWYHFFVALFPLTIAVMAAAAILPDRPKGYIQRVGLGVLAFALFGGGFGHLAYMANDFDYRPILLMLLFCVEANDVFAYVVGRSLGKHKLAPHTSPNKTVEGAVGALLITAPLVAVLAHFVFPGTPMDTPLWLATLGLIVSAAGQLGDLMLSSIKRDIGIKDTGNLIPGHGGLLDRFNSLILVAPAVFHYIGYFVGFGLDQQPRIFTG